MRLQWKDGVLVGAKEARRRTCPSGQHRDELFGEEALKCQLCGDVFPCEDLCNHFDCDWARQDPTVLEEIKRTGKIACTLLIPGGVLPSSG